MILSDFKAFPRKGRILGIDWGARRTGVAITDDTQEFFFARPPLGASRTGENMESQVAQLGTAEHVAAIVVGLPLRMDGTTSETTAAVRAFAARLGDMTDVPIFLIDETLSSFTAQSDMGRVRVDDIKKKLDSAAARLILENAVAMARRTS